MHKACYKCREVFNDIDDSLGPKVCPLCEGPLWAILIDIIDGVLTFTWDPLGE